MILGLPCGPWCVNHQLLLRVVAGSICLQMLRYVLPCSEVRDERDFGALPRVAVEISGLCGSLERRNLRKRANELQTVGVAIG